MCLAGSSGIMTLASALGVVVEGIEADLHHSLSQVIRRAGSQLQAQGWS